MIELLFYIFAFWWLLWLVFYKCVAIVDYFILLLPIKGEVFSNFIWILLITIPIIALVSAIRRRDKGIFFITFSIVILIICFPMKSYVLKQNQKEKESYSIEDYIEYNEEFDKNSKYYSESTPGLNYGHNGEVNLGGAHQVRYYNEETLKYDYYPVSYKFELKNMTNDKNKINDFAESLIEVYGKEEVLSRTFTRNKDYVLDLENIPFDDEDYNIYLLTYISRKEVDSEVFKKTDIFLPISKVHEGGFSLSNQDKEIVLQKRTKLAWVNATSLLNERESMKLNKTYVNYLFIAVPKVYNDYNLHVNSQALEDFSRVLDLKDVLKHFGL